MSFNKHVFFSSLTVILLAAIVCFKFFGEIILHPNEFLFGYDGDGLKNYYTVAYQVIHGEGLYFNGMLYPFGDHLIFADGQPLLTRILQTFIEPDVDNGSTIIGIMNLMMIASLVICAWCIHRILVWSYVNAWFAVPFALFIAFLSPQVARFTGHYALAYTCFVPISWLLIASFKRYEKPILSSLLSIAVVATFGFLHPYYVFIFAIFLGASLAWEFVESRFQIPKMTHFFPKLIAVFVPLLVFVIYQKSVDPYTDRPTSPSGIYNYMASFQSVFTPTADPFRELFHSYFFRIFIPTSWEGHAYIGMVPVFFAFASVFLLFQRAKKRRWKILTHPILPEALKVAFIPGIITLLFALGLFHKLGLQWLSEFITPIKQFRSLGRVAWIFYYTFSIWIVYHLYVLFRYYRQNSKGKHIYNYSLILILCGFFWMLDAIVNIKHTKAKLLDRSANEVFSGNYAKQWQESGVSIEDYQAILPLPMLLVGSEKIGLNNGIRSGSQAMIASFSSGLPLIGGAMSRTSSLVTEKSAQLVADSLFPRPILDDFKNDLKLLVLQSNEQLTKEEQRIAYLGEKVFECADYKLLSLSVEELKLMYSQIALAADTLQKQGKHKYLSPNEFEKTEIALWGERAFRVEALAQLLDTVFASNEVYNLSYWVKVIPEEELLPNRVYSVGGEWKSGGGIGDSPNVQNGWLFVSENIQAEAGKHHRFVTHARGGVISRIMLRKSDDLVVHEEVNGTRFVNNVPIRP